MENKLEEYASLSETIKTAEARKKVLQNELEEELGQKEVSITNTFGSFKMVARTQYEFTPKTTEAEEDLKIMKQDEIEQGLAKKSLIYGLRFNAAKN